MGRIPRSKLGKGVFHIINRGINQAWILESEEEKETILSLLKRHKAKYDVNIYNWVLMSNHFHFAIEAKNIVEVSNFIGKVSSLYSQWWHSKKGGCGTLWQGRFKSVLVQKDGYLLRLGRYIERNPVAAAVEGIKYPWDYSWSSAKAYVSLEDDKLVCIRKHPYWDQLGESDEKRSLYYKELISEKNTDDEVIFHSPHSIIGDDEFKSGYRLTSGRPSSSKPGRPRNERRKN